MGTVARWRLQFLNGPLKGQTRPIFDGLVIGRHSECDVQIQAGHLSRRHAQFHCHGDNLFVSDLDSANGTFVNEKRIHRQPVFVGDQVKVDEIAIRITDIAAPEGPAMDAAAHTVAITPQFLAQPEPPYRAEKFTQSTPPRRANVLRIFAVAFIVVLLLSGLGVYWYYVNY